MTCVLSIFQLLSEDYISYAFFMLFLGITIGGVHVITLPYVMEMVGGPGEALGRSLFSARSSPVTRERSTG